MQQEQQPPRKMIKYVKRQVSPAAFSGVTDQISNLGQSAGIKAANATSGLNKTQLSVLIVLVIIAFVLFVAGAFWVCSYSRRRKRDREMREKSERFQCLPSSSTVEAGSAQRYSRQGEYYSEGWGESRVALNSSFVVATNERYGWSIQCQPQMPSTRNQSQRY
ncbi:uncharacterized protein MEPE_06610 [Melanopsichium pennsylvanicum]|uniref:Transmembrane protein n=1 Tax=Melanopsichium pennsylvanicum TaxID=63383 RepID=A0AAJ5C8T1_9BASI|nr:uncharacterized protein MEPE_06610 [Melanopsichium pennsylvanicum]